MSIHMTPAERVADKVAVRNEIRALVKDHVDAGRILVTCNGARREQGELVNTLTSVNSDRDDLSEEDEAKVALAVGYLDWMVGEEFMTRQLEGIDTYYTPCASLAGRNTL